MCVNCPTGVRYIIFACRSLYTLKKASPKVDPWGTPQAKFIWSETPQFFLDFNKVLPVFRISVISTRCHPAPPARPHPLSAQ